MNKKLLLIFVMMMLLIVLVIKFIKEPYIDFSGNIIGGILGGITAYLIAKFQIDNDKKQREEERLIMEKEKLDEENRNLLPYFNIEGANKLVFNSLRRFPIQKVNIAFFYPDDKKVNFDESITNLGHIFPEDKKEFSVILGDKISRIDVTAELINNTQIYFTYGNGVQGAHFYKIIGSNDIQPYFTDGSSIAQEKAIQRANDNMC